MVHISATEKSDLELLYSRAIHLKEGLNSSSLRGKPSNSLERMAEAIKRQLELEESTMEKVGKSLTPIHIDEHKKMLEAIALLEFSWKANRISDEVYIKSLHYKLEFHQHYFDEAQLLSIWKEVSKPGKKT